jgi:hypothetical protein
MADQFTGCARAVAAAFAKGCPHYVAGTFKVLR